MIQQNGMINGVKGCREIQQTETGDLLATDGIDEVIMKGQKYSFSGVKFPVCTLQTGMGWNALTQV